LSRASHRQDLVRKPASIPAFTRTGFFRITPHAKQNGAGKAPRRWFKSGSFDQPLVMSGGA
jgi:hypothetical protein